MRSYGTYQNIRDGAWQCLIDHKINSLPVDILKICRELGFHVIKNSKVGILLPNERGRSYNDGNTWHIIYNDEAPVEVSRFTIAHELGHILLSHETKSVEYSHLRQIAPKPISEQQADKFAIRLLCPICVFFGLGLQSAEEIAYFCKVDINVAAKRAERMKKLYQRDKFFTSPLEKEIYENFRPFLEEQRAILNNNGK